MGNSLRCCLACVVPCGALDLIRIVHLNGHVEEITGPITAAEALKDYPNHGLSKPCCQGNNMVRRILILSPETELKRGSIYFLISVPEKKKQKKKTSPKYKSLSADHYDSYITSEKKKSSCRRSGVTAWRPHLESIYED